MRQQIVHVCNVYVLSQFQIYELHEHTTYLLF